ncbi:hypothetical protein SBADM41S_00259 [Streptomyces badius]
MVGAEIGVILLLLLLGLEYSASELVTSLKTQYPSGAVDFVLNATPGAVAALILGWGPVGAVALAGVTWISSSGVIAKIMTDLGRLGNRETPVILGVLVMEDLAMAVYLPLLTAMLAGVGLAGGSLALVIALGAVGLVLYLALRHGRLISRAVSSDNPEMLLLVVLGLTVLVAGVAQQLQVSAAVGAFLVGIALSGEVAEGARKLLTPLRDLFAAVFFVFFGLSTNPADVAGAAARGPAGRRHRLHQDRHRLLRGPPRGDRPARAAGARAARSWRAVSSPSSSPVWPSPPSRASAPSPPPTS